MILTKHGNRVDKCVELPTTTDDPHSMFRSADYTQDGTFLLGHMDQEAVIEYSPDGEVIWRIEVESPWGVTRLENGNTLVSGDHAGYVREYDRDGNVVWEFTTDDARDLGIKLYSIQQSMRLPNGNTMFANWCSVAHTLASQEQSVQLIEVDREKRLVWSLSQWNEPNLGPASFFHLPGTATPGSES